MATPAEVNSLRLLSGKGAEVLVLPRFDDPDVSGAVDGDAFQGILRPPPVYPVGLEMAEPPPPKRLILLALVCTVRFPHVSVRIDGDAPGIRQGPPPVSPFVPDMGEAGSRAGGS